MTSTKRSPRRSRPLIMLLFRWPQQRLPPIMYVCMCVPPGTTDCWCRGHEDGGGAGHGPVFVVQFILFRSPISRRKGRTLVDAMYSITLKINSVLFYSILLGWSFRPADGRNSSWTFLWEAIGVWGFPEDFWEIRVYGNFAIKNSSVANSAIKKSSAK